MKKQVEVNYLKPFLFLQGIVFAGKYTYDVQQRENFITIGYYVYKPFIDKKRKQISEYGIFVNLSNGTEVSEYDQAIAAYYKHLKCKSFFSGEDYTFIPGIFKGVHKDIMYYNHIIKSQNLAEIG